MEDILQSYLVRLGFGNDEPSFQKFKSLLAQADATVERHADGVVKTLFKAQVGITSAFTSITGAIVAMVDKVAMADQGYQIMATKMLMTKDSARALTMITDALGLSIADIIWNPEQLARAQLMQRDITMMTEGLGPDFDKKLQRVRDLRFEFLRLGPILKFGAMDFVSSLVGGFNLDGIIAKVHAWVDWLRDHLPQIADKVATFARPILIETWHLFLDIGEAAKAFGTLFTNVIGLLSGDSSIEGSAFSFDKMAKAIEHVLHWMDKLVHAITSAEILLAHFASGVALLFAGKWGDAGKEFGAGFNKLTGGSGAVLGSVAGSVAGAAGAAYVGSEVGGALGAVVGGPVGAVAGTAAGALAGYGIGKFKQALFPSSEAGTSSDQIAPPASSGTTDAFDRIALAIEKQEGYYKGTLAFRNNNPGNLRYKGQPGAEQGEGGFARFKDYDAGHAEEVRQLGLYASRGLTLEQALTKWAPPNENNTAAYIANVAGSTGFNPNARLNSLTSKTTIGSIPITIHHANPDPETIGRVVHAKVTEAMDAQTQGDLIQLG